MLPMTKRRRKGHCDHASLLEGRVEILAHRQGVLFYHEVLKNILLFQGLAEVIRTLSFSSPTAPRIITRLAIGDQGTIPTDPTVPKVPVKAATGLYHEIYRKDVDTAVTTLYSPAGITYTGNTTINSNQLTNMASLIGVTSGMGVTGTGIPLGAVVTNILSPTVVEISVNATSTNIAASITFSGATNETVFSAVFNASDVPLTSFSNPSLPVVNEVGLVIIDPTAPAGITRVPVSAPSAPPSDEVLLSIRTFNSVPFVAANNISITIRYTLFTE